jgi:hypothetical protein
MASVAGLAPARTSLKGWTLELLCIHGQKQMVMESKSTSSLAHLSALTLWFCSSMTNGWPPRLVSRQCLLLFREALICLSYLGWLRTATITKCNRLLNLWINWLAEPKLQEQRLVVPRGNAPRSAAYRAAALLLSYRTRKVNRETP